jgi:hypothetical protein
MKGDIRVRACPSVCGWRDEALVREMIEIYRSVWRKGAPSLKLIERQAAVA